MNDFDYENLQKKRVAAGARHMKRGSKSKKCTMPSDYLTAAQRKKMNGDVRVMNMNAAVNWADFKQWPSDVQKEYLEHRMNDFNCTISGLAEILGVDVAHLRKKMFEIGFDMSRFAVGRKMTKENRAKMLEWIQASRPDATLKTYSRNKKAVAVPAQTEDNVVIDEVVAPDPVIEADESIAKPVVARVSLMKTPFVKMDFLGTLNPHQIVNTLLALAKDCNVKVSVTLEYQEGE